MRQLLLVLLASASLPVAALAHHGRDFLVTSSYKTPDRGALFGVLSSDYLRSNHDGDSGYDLSPAILYGFTDAWSAELHTHHGFDGGSPALEAVALESMIRLLGENAGHEPGAGAPFSLAVLGEYGWGMHGTPDAAEGRLVIGKELGPLAGAANLIAEKRFEEGEELQIRFAAGVRATVLPELGAGLELESSGEEGEGPLLTPGVYTALLGGIDLRLGASIDLDHRTLNAVRSQLIYEF